jgi:hypothetical protein
VVVKFRDEVVVGRWYLALLAHAVFRTPDVGRKEHPKHVEEICSEIKYRLLSAASCWKLIYIRLVMHGTMNVKFAKRCNGKISCNAFVVRY